MKPIHFVAFALFLFSGADYASAQGITRLCVPGTTGNCIPVDASNPLPVTGGGGGGGGAVYGPTATGSPAANPPVIIGGTATGSATGNVQGVTMKPASTAALATDPALVVVESPNSGILAAIQAAVPAGTNHIGSVSIDASTTGGATAYGLQATASTNSTLVSTGAHTLVGMNLLNTTTTIYYLRMYDAAGAPTCSSATGYIRSWPIPPAAAAGGAGGIAVSLPSFGTGFASGIGFCVTGGPSSTDNTNAATGIFINLDYK